MLSLRVRFLIQMKYILRTLGLEIINALCRRWSNAEPPKSVLRRSRWIVLSRCAVHVAPSVVFLFLIPLNFSAMYVGPGFSSRISTGFYLVLFQIGAKILEIVCVASLTTVLLHVLRHDLMRDGVPLGFVGSGIFFSQANYFWSPEMYAGALHSVKTWKRLRLLILITVAGALALLIAPSSAVLLQPRSQNVPAGGTNYFLPVAPDQLWPSTIDGSDELPDCYGIYSAQNVACASAGFESLRSYFQNLNTSWAIPLMLWDTYQLQPIVIQSLAGEIPHFSITGSVFGLGRETFALQPNAMTAIFQNALTNDWRDATKHWSGSRFSSESQYQYATERLSSVVSTSPVVLPRCSLAQNVSTGIAQIKFPVKTWADAIFSNPYHPSAEWDDDGKAYNVTIQTYNIPQNVRYQWIDLPVNQFGPVSGGFLLYLPRAESNTTQAVVGCSISASWYSGHMASDSSTNEAAWSITESRKQWARIRTDLNASGTEASKYRRLISLHDGWFRSLTPTTPCVSHRNQSQSLTILECIFSDVGLPTVFNDMRTKPQPVWNGKSCNYQMLNDTDTDVNLWNRLDCGNGGKHQLLEMILASSIANGLSRYGSRYAFDQASIGNSPSNPTQWSLKSLPKASDYYSSLLRNKPQNDAILPPPPSATSDHINLRMKMQVVGYAWYVSGFSEYLAIAVIVIYVFVALAHTVWVVSTGVTSSSWDTVTELLALALQSPVTDTLRGSSAGIERLGTYRRMAKLRVRDEAGDSKVVLLVDEEESDEKDGSGPSQAPRPRYKTIEIDKEYS